MTRTNDANVKERVFILLARGRFSLNQTYRSKQTSLLVESLVVLGFKGQIDRPQFLTEDEINDLWSVQPSGNVPGGQAEMILNQLIPKFNEPQFTSKIHEIMLAEGERIRDAHQRVRSIVNKEIGIRNTPSSSNRFDITECITAGRWKLMDGSFSSLRIDGGMFSPEFLLRVADANPEIEGCSP